MLFETAALVFEDEHHVSVPDPHPDADRWRTIGRVGSQTLFVVHMIVEPDGFGADHQRAAGHVAGEEAV